MQYSIEVRNQSQLNGSVCLFQHQPDISSVPSVYSIAWMVQPSGPGMTSDFNWSIDYGFVWSESGTLSPGVTFQTSQHVPADLNSANQITFTNAGGRFTFVGPGGGAPRGSLMIHSDMTIPPNSASVGISMSGAGTFAVGAAPSMTFVFTPHPTYWLAFGAFRPGQVLPPDIVTNAVKVVFPTDVTKMQATFGAGQRWTISPRS
jgi:hypothetical protein